MFRDALWPKVPIAFQNVLLFGLYYYGEPYAYNAANPVHSIAKPSSPTMQVAHVNKLRPAWCCAELRFRIIRDMASPPDGNVARRIEIYDNSINFITSAYTIYSCRFWVIDESWYSKFTLFIDHNTVYTSTLLCQSYYVENTASMPRGSDKIP